MACVPCRRGRDGAPGKCPVGKFGLTAARIMLTRLDFAHGWHMTGDMKAGFDPDTDELWRRAGTSTYAREGLFRVQPGSKGFHSKKGVMALALSSPAQSTRVLTLNGQDNPASVWAIKTGSALTTARGSSVAFMRGGVGCNFQKSGGDSRRLIEAVFVDRCS